MLFKMLLIIVVLICIISLYANPDYNQNLKLFVLNNTDCYINYFKYIKPTQYENKNNKIDISFIDYLEYWWDSVISIEELIDKVCIIIEEKKMIKIINYQNNRLSELLKIKMLI